MLSSLDEYMGTFVSKAWVQKNILRFTEADIRKMQQEIDKENKAGELDMPDPDDPRFG
jgi:hypothetical protein